MKKPAQKTILLTLFLLFLTNACLDPLEKDTRCTKCQPTENLENGSCFTKIRGCLKQSNTTCTQCQDGYVKDSNSCTRYAEYFNITSLAPAAVKLESTSLSASDITPVLAGGFQESTNFNSSTYTQAKATLLKEYPVLVPFKIYKVEQQIVNGVNYMFYIINTENYDLYLAKVYVTLKLEGSVTQIYKNDVSILKNQTPVQGTQPLPGVWKQLTSYNDSRYLEALDLIKKTYPRIDTYVLQKTDYQVVAGINFLFYYLSPNSEKFTLQIYKPFYGPATVKNQWGTKPPVQTSITQTPSPISGGLDIVPASEYTTEPFLSVAKVIKAKFPNFNVAQVKKVQRQIVAGWNLIVTFSDGNSTDVYDVMVFVPLAYTGKQPEIQSVKKNGVAYPLQPSTTPAIPQPPVPTTQIEPSPKVGAWKEFTDLTDKRLIASQNVLIAKYKTLNNYKLTRVESQIVSGINFRLFYEQKDTKQTFIAQIYYPLSGDPQISNVWDNSSSGSQTVTSTNSDERVTILATEFNQEPYISAKSTIQEVFPEFDDYLVEKVQKQTVSGWNVFITFTLPDSGDLYDVVVFIPLPETGGIPQITSIMKNGDTYEPENQVSSSDSSSQSSIMTGGYSSNVNESSPLFIEAKTALLKEYPFLEGFDIKNISSQIVSGMNYQFTLVDSKTNDLYVARVYVTLSRQASVEEITKNGVDIMKDSSTASNLSTLTVSAPQPISVDTNFNGGWQSVASSEYNSEPFLTIQSEILKYFPTFSTKLIQKASNQIVAGWNYAISFTLPNSTDIYEIKIYLPLSYTGRGPSITQAKKNGSIFTLTPIKIQAAYNYQTDSKFTELYRFFKTQVKISNLLPIADVSRQLKSVQDSDTKFYEYNITYSSDEYAICRWYQDFNVFEVVSYISDKTELYQLASKLSNLPLLRTEGILTEKVKDYDPKRFSRVLIKDITQIKLSENIRIFRLNAFSASGHYNMTILDRGELFVVQVQFVDSQKGFAIKIGSIVQYRQEYVIDQIKIFLFSRYSLSGYSLTLAVVNAFDTNTNQYVMLLARDDLKKVKVSVEETNGTFTIRKLEILNNGLYVVSDAISQKAVDEAARKQFSASLTGFQRAFFLTNGTLNVAVYSNDTSMSTYFNNTSLKVSDLKNKPFSKPQTCLNFQQITKNCIKCSQTDILWRGKCYPKVKNCGIQLGSQCLSCDKQSLDVKGICVKDYTTDLFI